MMMRRLLALLTLTLATASTAAAQVDYNTSAYGRARDIVRILEACTSQRTACQAPTVARIVAFAAAPFDRAQSVPTRSEIDAAASEAAVSLRIQQDGKPSLSLSATEFIGTSQLAWALADFLANRAKAELTQAALRDLAKELEKGAGKVLLARSLQVMSSVGELDYRVLLPTLRSAFREDLRALPTQLGALDATVVTNTQVLRRLQLLGRAGSAYKRLESGNDALAVLADWPGGEAPSTLFHGERLVSGLAREVRLIATVDTLRLPSGGDRTGLPPSDFDQRVTLVLRDAKLVEVLTAVVMSDAGLRARVTDAALAVERLRAALASTMEMRQAARAISAQGATADERLAAKLRLVSAVASFARNSLLNDSDIGDPATVAQLIDLGVQLWSAVDANDYPRIVVLGIGALRTDAGVDSSKIPGRALAFAAALAGAKDEDDVESALEALADPVGSFRSRRLAGNGTVAVVAYVGVSGGREALVGASDSEESTFRGLSVPLGIEFAWGTKANASGRRCAIRSLGFHLGILDFGTLMSYRVGSSTADAGAGEEQVAQVPEARWDHVFAPSARFTLGLTERYPLTLGAGWQQAPRLRTLEASSTRVSASRWFVFAGVDLTLLKF